MTNEDLQQIQTLVSAARKVAVITHKNPSIDVLASALAIKLAMGKMGKDTNLIAEIANPSQFSFLSGAAEIKNSLVASGGGNLVLSYSPYSLGDIEKVSYIEDEGANTTFKLTLIPREGLTLDSKNFSFSTSGGGTANFDLVYTVEVVTPPDLGPLFTTNIFNNPDVKIINVDNHDENKDYGKFNLIEPQAATVSEITTFFLRAVNAQMDKDIASNLYQGLLAGSDRFQAPRVTAATFEAAAICLRAGAKPNTHAPHHHEIPVSPPTENVVTTAAQEQPQPVKADWTPPKVYRGTSTV